jgi:hypothetical protein
MTGLKPADSAIAPVMLGTSGYIQSPVAGVATVSPSSSRFDPSAMLVASLADKSKS